MEFPQFINSKLYTGDNKNDQKTNQNPCQLIKMFAQYNMNLLGKQVTVEAFMSII